MRNEGGADFAGLVAQAQRVREHAIRMATDGGCFIGASLSCADLIVYLYDRVLRVTPQTLADPERDYLLLSKGHDVPGAVRHAGRAAATSRSSGWPTTCRSDDHMYWHPNRAIPGVEFHSGSLGHLLSVAWAIATGHQAARRGDPRVRRRSATASWTRDRSGRRRWSRAPSGSTT